MIFYFTGTGNSLEVAEIVSAQTGEKLIDIGKSYKYKQFEFTIPQGENLGFIFPTYACSTPSLIDNFLRHASFKNKQGESFVPEYCYLILTCGSFVGNTAKYFAKELNELQGINLDASFSVKTVGNCVSLYAPAEGEERERVLDQARKKSQEVAESVANRTKLHAEKRGVFGVLMSQFSNTPDKPRSTEEFYTLPTCVHCGQCADICPTNTITMIESVPRWAEMGCTQCYACIHRCPAHAIQYGRATETRGRYINPVLLNQE